MTVLSGLLLYLSVRAGVSLLAIGVAVVPRAPKARSARSFPQRPLLGRWSNTAVKRLTKLAQGGPDAVLTGSSPSSAHHPLPRPQYPALGAGGVSLAAVDGAPNIGAFSAGVELGIFVALFTISSLLVLNWIVKTMRSSK